MAFVNQVLTILVTSPGNLVYHLVLVFSVAVALWTAFSQWRTTQFPQAKRMVTGLGLLLAAQLLQFAVSGLVWLGLVNPGVVLPPLDRAVVLFSIIWAAWLWAFPEPLRSADLGAIILSAVDGIGLVLAIILRAQESPLAAYNDTFGPALWAIASMAVAVLGLVVLLRRKPSGWQNGVAFLGLVLLGEVLGLLFDASGASYSGAVRFMTVAAYPLLMTLPQRFPTPAAVTPRQAVLRPSVPSEEGAEAPSGGAALPERRRYSTDPKTLHSLLDLASELDANKINGDIARAIAQAMLADLTFLIYLGEDRKSLSAAAGYDLIREERLEGLALNKEAIPLLANAVQRGRPLRLPASSTSSDLKGLGDLLGLSSPGHLLSVPVTSEKQGPLGSILVLSPYSNRLWNSEDQTFLSSIAATLLPIVERGQRISAIEAARQQAESDLAEVRSREEALSGQLEALKTEAQGHAEQADRLVALMAVHEEVQRRLAALERENEDLRAGAPATAVAPADTQYLENELRLTLQEVARLQNALAESNMKILEIEKMGTASVNGQQAEMIASISQELRQPMSSILGYTDLLLGESVGILGAMQRKFIERIKAATDRVGSLVEDLIQITTIEAGLATMKPEPIDVNLIIDNAMAYTSSQMRERNIALRINIARTLEPIYADREALQQILIHLLQNAGAASPVEGEVTLKVDTEKQEGNTFLLMQVTDTGGGIPAEELPRVFSRLYRADNVLIQGVGDTGVGLSIAKALTEAQGGRIWVEPEMGSGSTFSVLLPAQPADADEPVAAD
jgi:signal transduction histidine kinase